MEPLQNETMTLYYHRLVVEGATVTIADVETIYERTTPNSPLRRFVVDFAADNWHFCDSHKVLSSEFLTDVLERLEEFNQPPGACHFDAVWIEKMNKHFCSLYHNHGTKDSGDDADDSGMMNHLNDVGVSNLTIDGPDDTSRTVGRPDEAGSDDFKEESSPPLSPVASYYVQNVELDGMWTFGVLGPAVAYQDCGNTSSDDSDLGS